MQRAYVGNKNPKSEKIAGFVIFKDESAVELVLKAKNIKILGTTLEVSLATTAPLKAEPELKAVTKRVSRKKKSTTTKKERPPKKGAKPRKSRNLKERASPGVKNSKPVNSRSNTSTSQNYFESSPQKIPGAREGSMEGSKKTLNERESHKVDSLNRMTNKNPSLISQLQVGGAESKNQKEKDRLFGKRPKLLPEVAENHTLTNLFFRPSARRYFKLF